MLSAILSRLDLTLDDSLHDRLFSINDAPKKSVDRNRYGMDRALDTLSINGIHASLVYNENKFQPWHRVDDKSLEWISN